MFFCLTKWSDKTIFYFNCFFAPSLFYSFISFSRSVCLCVCECVFMERFSPPWLYRHYHQHWLCSKIIRCDYLMLNRFSVLLTLAHICCCFLFFVFLFSGNLFCGSLSLSFYLTSFLRWSALFHSFTHLATKWVTFMRLTNCWNKRPNGVQQLVNGLTKLREKERKKKQNNNRGYLCLQLGRTNYHDLACVVSHIIKLRLIQQIITIARVALLLCCCCCCSSLQLLFHYIATEILATLSTASNRSIK